MLYYRSGVFSGCDKTDDVDHAVLLIGYKAGVGWKIKNSWGKRWG
jgi:C1A family cysteine protease